MQKSIIVFLLFVGLFTNAQAQTAAPRYDTVTISVFNTGAKYRVAAAEFGAHASTLFTKSTDFIGEMVAGNDTVHTWGTKKCDTCKIQKTQTTLTVSHGCAVVNGNMKDKVVILDLGTCKDATRMALSAQKQGAKAIIFTHWHDNRDSITLKIDAGNKSRDVMLASRADSVKIPVFTVRNSTGAKMSAMLPSGIGMREPKILKNDTTQTQAMKQMPEQNPTGKNSLPVVTATTPETENKSGSPVAILNNRDSLTAQVTGINAVNFSPNPTENVIYLHYKFDAPQTVRLTITNASGMKVFSGGFSADNTEGVYEIETNGWANGIYIAATTSNGVKLSAEKIVVQR